MPHHFIDLGLIALIAALAATLLVWLKQLPLVGYVAAGALLITEAGGLVGNFTGEADFLDQQECLAGNPRIYGQLITLLGKYSKFASAGEKAALRQKIEN